MEIEPIKEMALNYWWQAGLAILVGLFMVLVGSISFKFIGRIGLTIILFTITMLVVASQFESLRGNHLNAVGAVVGLFFLLSMLADGFRPDGPSRGRRNGYHNDWENQHGYDGRHW